MAAKFSLGTAIAAITATKVTTIMASNRLKPARFSAPIGTPGKKEKRRLAPLPSHLLLFSNTQHCTQLRVSPPWH
jgi:hypothetical protein